MSSSSASQAKLKVGVLGATGTVGQRFILQLAEHPQFELAALGASSSSAGKTYAQAVEGRWKQIRRIPSNVAQMPVYECQAHHFAECAVVFSGLDSGPAGPVEDAFRKAELRVFFQRQELPYRPAVSFGSATGQPGPYGDLAVPEAAGGYQDRLHRHQRQLLHHRNRRATQGARGEVWPARPCAGQHDAGHLGRWLPRCVSSLDILDNVVPFISGEEEKIEWETAKILGGIKSDKTAFDYHEQDELKVSAHCNRVPVIDGHMECVSVSFKQRPARRWRK